MTRLPIATIAAQEFQKRQQRAREVVRNRGMTVRTAEQHLRPWLAIACLCGADLPELAQPISERRKLLSDAPQGPRSITDEGQNAAALLEMESRWLAADDICPRARWVPVLAAARDDAFSRYLADSTNETLADAAAALQRLCLHLAYDINGHNIPTYRAPAAQAAAA